MYVTQGIFPNERQIFLFLVFLIRRRIFIFQKAKFTFGILNTKTRGKSPITPQLSDIFIQRSSKFFFDFETDGKRINTFNKKWGKQYPKNIVYIEVL